MDFGAARNFGKSHTFSPKLPKNVLAFSDSWFPGFSVSRGVVLCYSMLFSVSRFLGFSVSRILVFSDSRFLGFSFSRILGFSVICLEVSEGFIPGAAFFKPIIEIQSDSILEKLIPIYMTSDHVKDMSLLS